MNYLIRNRHGNIFHARVVVPKRLRFFFKKSQLKHTCRTSDFTQAKKIARAFKVWCDAQFEKADEMLRAQQKGGSTSEIYTIGLSEITLHGTKLTFDFSHIPDPLEQARAERDAVLAAMRLSLEHSAPQSPQLANPASQIANLGVPESPMTLGELIQTYSEVRRRMVAPRRRKETITHETYKDDLVKLEFWKSHFGAATPAYAITRKAINDALAWLPYIRPQFAKRGISNERAIAEAKAVYKAGGGKLLSESSQNKYMGPLRGLLSYGFKIGAIREDLSALFKAKRGATTLRRAFSLEDLQKIFPGAKYGIIDFGKDGSNLTYAAKFWLPLFALFTGARLEELAQLTPASVEQDEGTGAWFIRISDEGIAPDGRPLRVKNQNSVRAVPLHKVLIDAGFIQYFESVKAKSGLDVNLWGLKRSKREDAKFGDKLGPWFSRFTTGLGYLQRRGVEARGQMSEHSEHRLWSKSFHSFRHTVVAALKAKRGQGVNLQDISLIVGHLAADELSADEQRELTKQQALQTHSYGLDLDRAKEYFELRRKIIQHIEYPGVDFATIRWREV